MKVYEVVKWLGRQAAAGRKDKGQRREERQRDGWLYGVMAL